MAYLVNDQTGEAIEIPEGESTVGRGPLLKITDKRVSRNHALLQLENGKFKLCPKHKNPCFYKAVGETNFTVLSKDVWQELHHGDLFRLLPDALIFRIVEKSNSKNSSKDDSTVADEQMATKPTMDTKPSGQKKSDTFDLLDELFCDPNAINKTEPTSTTSSSKSEIASTKVTKQIADSRSSSGVAEPSALSLPTLDSASTQSPTAKGVEEEDTVKSKVKKEDSHSSSEKAGSTNKPRKLPDWLAGVTGRAVAASSTVSKAPASRKRKAPSSSSSSSAKHTKAASPDEDKHSDMLPSPPPIKKAAPVKETMDISTSNTEKKPSTKKEPVTAASNTSTSSKVTTGSKGKDKDKKKPLCPYGTKCYRKNPVHFKEYSHDFSSADANSEGDDGGDSDDPDRPLCPYGADCYRAPKASELARKRKIASNPPLGKKKSKGPVASEPA